MLESTRFACPSACLTLKSLLKRTRNGLWIGAGYALAIHLSLTQIGSFDGEQKAAKPLTTQFITRQPRLTKPLELKKRPRPKRRRIQRKMVSLNAKVEHQRVSSRLSAAEIVRSLATPRAALDRFASFQPLALETNKGFAHRIASSRESKDVVDMSLEMMDVNALDTGKYHAMVIQDPTNKKNIRGFFHIALVYPFSMRSRNTLSWEDRVNYGIVRLAHRMNEWTPIRTDVTHRLSLDDRELFETPWVYLLVQYSIEPTESEVRNLGQYLLQGGFFMAEGAALETPGYATMGYQDLMHFIKDALASEGWVYGREWSHDVLAHSHPIFHVYYDFDGPPAGIELFAVKYFDAVQRHPDGIDPVVRGIVLDGRVAAITDNQKYGLAWGSYGPDAMPSQRNSVYGTCNPRRQLEFGVNTIIFALTQEGSITHRVMEEMR